MSVCICTADPVSACYCTSYDLVQCRGKGGRDASGRGGIQNPSLQFSLLQYAITLLSPFIFMPYTATWSLEMLNCRFITRCATATQLWPMHPQRTTLRMSAGPIRTGWLCKLCTGSMNEAIEEEDSSRNEELERICFADGYGYFYTTTPTLMLLLKAMSSAHVKLAASHCSHTEMKRCVNATRVMCCMRVELATLKRL